MPRVVINWANIRQARARSSPAVGRLEPGDSVMVDSLRGGWYRVLMDGRPVGYLHRTSVGTVLTGER
ncbi:MAG TPA: SH3 domain-containing protein [Gemmatimonadales bacterium]|nr:SH3 domain-containing protein [Gemmatimonadales bacterium]